MNKLGTRSGFVVLGVMVATAVTHLLTVAATWQLALQGLILLLTAAGVDNLHDKRPRQWRYWLLPLLLVWLWQQLLLAAVGWAWGMVLLVGGVFLWGLLASEAAELRWVTLVYTHLLCGGLVIWLLTSLSMGLMAVGLISGLWLLFVHLFEPLEQRFLYAGGATFMVAPLSMIVSGWLVTPLQVGLMTMLLFYLVSAYLVEQANGRFRPLAFIWYLLIVCVGLILVSFIS